MRTVRGRVRDDRRAEGGVQIGRTTAYDLMSKGLLPDTQLGTRRLIPRAAVARLLAAGLIGGSEFPGAMK